MTDIEIAPVEVLQPSAVEQIVRAEVDMQIATAKRYPRDAKKASAAMMNIATLDEDTAASCFYNLPRGGKELQGPSVRMAEIALSQWGNARAATRIISKVTEGPNPHVVIQGVCHDLETNVAVLIEKTRAIHAKRANKGVPDADDINLAVNACSAIAFRESVFKVVPKSVVNGVTKRCMEIAIGNAETLVSRRAKLVSAFAKMGVTEKVILASLGYTGLDQVTLEDLANLRGTYTAIKEDQITIESAFPPKIAPEPAATTAPNLAASGMAPGPAPEKVSVIKNPPGRKPAKIPEPVATPTPPPAPDPAPEQDPTPDPEPPTTAETVPLDPIPDEVPIEESPAPPTDNSPNSKLEAKVKEAGYTFGELKGLVQKYKWFPADSWKGFADIKEEAATRLLSSMKVITKGLAQATGRPSKIVE